TLFDRQASHDAGARDRHAARNNADTEVSGLFRSLSEWCYRAETECSCSNAQEASVPDSISSHTRRRYSDLKTPAVLSPFRTTRRRTKTRPPADRLLRPAPVPETCTQQYRQLFPPSFSCHPMSWIRPSLLLSAPASRDRNRESSPAFESSERC